MPSEVDICNIALLQIGHTVLIQDLTEDSEAANACNVLYAQNRDETLQDLAWPFAQRRSLPTALVATTLALGAVPTGWEYAFALPADAVAKGLVAIYPGVSNPRSDQEVQFEIQYDAALGALIVLCHVDAPEFVYTAKVTDPNLFPPSFLRAVAWNLSDDLVLALRKDPKLGQLTAGRYAAALASARRDALVSGRHDLEPVPAHIAAR